MAGDDQMSPLPFEWFAEINPRLDGLWLVKKLLPAVGLALIYGYPGSGKSFLALDIAFHVALGRDWNGRRVQQGLVVYVGAEGGNGLRNRIFAFRTHYRVGKIPLALIDVPIDLQNPVADTPRLIQAIRAAAAECGTSPALIVIDTLSKTFGNGKENTDDMVAYVANCQRVASAFDCCVMPVHHRPKDETSSEPRGHGSLKGGVDTVILVEAGKPKRVSVSKQKDADPAEDMAFELVQVVIGNDEDSEAVTSCVVEFTDAPAPRSRGNGLSPAAEIVLRALRQTIDKDGELAPSKLPESLDRRGVTFRVATREAWRARSIEALAGPDKRSETISRTFLRHSEKLQALGMVMCWEGYVWPLS